MTASLALPDDPDTLRVARKIAHFVEDQFIVWSDPLPFTANPSGSDWILPCGLEQYSYYVPIDASAVKPARLFETIYRKTGDDRMHQKAVALFNTMTHAQDRETGRYFTYWIHHLADSEGWINCAVFDAKCMLEFAEENQSPLLSVSPANSFVLPGFSIFSLFRHWKKCCLYAKVCFKQSFHNCPSGCEPEG